MTATQCLPGCCTTVFFGSGVNSTRRCFEDSYEVLMTPRTPGSSLVSDLALCSLHTLVIESRGVLFKACRGCARTPPPPPQPCHQRCVSAFKSQEEPGYVSMTWFPNTALDETSFCRSDSRNPPSSKKSRKKSIK